MLGGLLDTIKTMEEEIEDLQTSKVHNLYYSSNCLMVIVDFDI